MLLACDAEPLCDCSFAQPIAMTTAMATSDARTVNLLLGGAKILSSSRVRDCSPRAYIGLMSQQSDLAGANTTLPPTRVHILGAGPVGLLMTALLQSTERFSVHLYEKRRDYTRTRMVQVAPYLVADSVASYCTD